MDKMELRRPQQAAPTEPGWYYGTVPGAVAIIPVHVSRYRSVGDLGVWDWQLGVWHDPASFKWFGPVPECIEATVPG